MGLSIPFPFWGLLNKQEAFEKCWAHSPLRAAARPNLTLPFTRCCYCRMPPLSHAACASMSMTTATTTTTTTVTTRDRGDRDGPIEWAQKAARVEVNIFLAFLYWVGIALHPWPFVPDIAIYLCWKGTLNTNSSVLCVCELTNFAFVIHVVWNGILWSL